MANPLDQWNVSGETVTLSRKQDTLQYFKGKDCSQACPISFDLMNIYGIKRAEKIIAIFHDVIQTNLEEKIHSQAFLPLLLTEGYEPIESRETVYYKPHAMKQVALFAQHGFGKKRFFSERWAVFNLANRKISVYQVEKTNKEVYEFLDKVRSKFRDPSKKDEYAEYVRQFRPIIISSGGKITSVVMRCVSKYDTNVLLTEDNWAITVVSTLQGSNLKKDSESSIPKNDSNFGHVMIVCEGLENGRLFFKYAHITNRRIENERDSNREQNEAEVEIRDKKIKSDTLNGPTWSRQRHLVERMLQSIRNAESNHRYVRFSRIRDVSDSAQYLSTSTIRITAYSFVGVSIVATCFAFSSSCSANTAKLAAAKLTKRPFPSRHALAAVNCIGQELANIADNVAIDRKFITAINYANVVANASKSAAEVAFKCVSGTIAVIGVSSYFGAPNIKQIRSNSESPHSCASWVRQQLLEAGIKIQLPIAAITPNAMVKSLMDKRNVTFCYGVRFNEQNESSLIAANAESETYGKNQQQKLLIFARKMMFLKYLSVILTGSGRKTQAGNTTND